MRGLMVLTSHDKLGDTSRAASKMPIGTTRICRAAKLSKSSGCSLEAGGLPHDAASTGTGRRR
jgi:hypothetical protein